MTSDATPTQREATYLDYLEIYVRDKDPNTHLFRTLVDDWFGYHFGGPFLNANGRPKWFNNPDPVKDGPALRSMHFISSDAMLVLQRKRAGRLVKDHALPLCVLRLQLLRSGSVSRDEIRVFLSNYFRLGLITKEEDGQLSECGLRQKLPKGSDELDWLARYEHAGIVGGVATGGRGGNER